jgi:hypothetical protein
MTKTSRERRHFPVPMRWPHAGSDPSRPSHRGQRTLNSLTSSQRLPKRLSHASNPTSVQIRRPHSTSITSTPEIGVGIKSP